MGRTQTFDTAAVVRAARTVFWQHGFEAASVPALEAATGLNRSSLYHAFGSKRGLFDAAVESYLDEVIRPRLRPLREPVPHADAIVDYLRGVRDALAEPGSISSTNGCLLVNTATSPIARDAAVADAVSDYRTELRGCLERGIRARFPEDGEAAIGRLTDSCTALVIAGFALTRVDNAAALASLDAAMQLVAARSPRA